jgi:putative nucleotidyltransferase with HDIG domain
MNSLKVKFLGLSTLLAIMVVVLTVWHHLSTQRTNLEKLAVQNSRVLTFTIFNSISTFMKNGENERITEIFEEIRKEPSLKFIYIFDESGKVLRSSDPLAVEELAPSSDLLAYRSNQFYIRHDHNGSTYHARFLPIYNEPACYGCHDQTKKVLGILSVHISLNQMIGLLDSLAPQTLVTFLLMFCFLILTITLFVFYYVGTPIRKLINAIDHLERGEFDQATVSIATSSEMAQLSNKFNRMVNRLKLQIHERVKQERKIAVGRQKLTHQEEIQEMNQTLGERLKENRYLNTSLEKRIREIEEANYKIADLASELESKNTNLQQAVNRLSALYDMGLTVNATMDLNRLFQLLIEKTCATLKVNAGYLLLLDKKTDELTIGGTFGLSQPPPVDLRISLEAGGVSEWVIRNRKPLLIKDIHDSDEFNKVSKLGLIRETVICAPLLVKGEPIGTITMTNRNDGLPFYSEDLDLLSTIAAQAGIAIRNAQLYEDQQVTYLNTVQALVSAIEANDAYTIGHSERVTQISLALAGQLNLTPEQTKCLEQASILHDIGKIGIDISLLNKKEKLTEKDIETLQRHPMIGAKILEPIQFLQDVRRIIEQHHERYDGKGYPNHLAGESILIEARILAVADTYDAMTSDRPYRKALPPATAFNEIRAFSGTQFDPEVAEFFLTMIRSSDSSV